MAEEVKQRIIRPQAGFQEKFVRTNVDVCISGGVLNPQPMDSLVATPEGFVRIGDLKAGDIICDTKGGTQTVNFVLDKGLQPCVEFTLSDGRKVQSALSHSWLVKERHGKVLKMSSQEIMDYIDREEQMRATRTPNRVNRLRIPLCAPCQFNDIHEQERKIHPYVLGFLLGDGCLSEKGHSIYISVPKSDYHVVEYIRSLGYNLVIDDKNDPNCMHYAFRGGKIRSYLQELGLLGKLSYNKFIPDAYKFAPIKDRIALLQGLFDSDGSCEKRTGQASFHSTSKKLIDDIQSIVWSIGGIANYSSFDEYKCTIKGKLYNCRKSYMLRVRTDDDKQLFHFDRKKKFAKKNADRRWKVMVSISSYKLIEDKPMKCLNVDDENHLYLTNNYIITCNCGKTAGAVLMCAEPSLDSKFRAVFLRNNLGDAKAGGGILDEFKAMYTGGVSVTESGDPHVDFPSGARIDVTHIADQTREKVRQRFKGRQYDLIYFDEMTGFSWECFVEVCTRNRGTGKWTGKIRGTTNPDRNHWLRVFLDWYIGVDGFIRPDRDGVIRYFYIAGESVKDVVWGDDKDSVYRQCKIDIDRKLKRINGNSGKATYKDLIRSFTFYLGKMSENVASIGNNSGYVGAVAMSGGRNAEQLLEGNWNVSPNEDLNAPIPSDLANQVFISDPQVNNDKWITADLADVGTDNFLALAWNGFHAYDILMLGKTTPRENAERLLIFSEKHGIPNSHIIYDGIRGRYINDYIPEAIPFISNMKPRGMYGRMALRLKDECYLRLVEMIKRGELSFADELASKVYEHQLLKESITIQNEFLEECAVVRFKDVQSGKKTLLTKKEMNQMLGKGRSMDLLDPCAMRMFPVLELPYGDELTATYQEDDEYMDDDISNNSIYDETLWC